MTFFGAVSKNSKEQQEKFVDNHAHNSLRFF